MEVLLLKNNIHNKHNEKDGEISWEVSKNVGMCHIASGACIKH